MIKFSANPMAPVLARAEGMITMYDDGAGKAWRGETTVEDVLRATRVV